jgi:hypothetical protein
MYYLRARYYNPLTGRFLSVDSQAGQGQRRYEYAGADPVNGIDPTGNEAIIEWALLTFYPGRIPIHFPGFPSWCGFEMGGFMPGCGGGPGDSGGQSGSGAGPGAPAGPPPPPPPHNEDLVLVPKGDSGRNNVSYRDIDYCVEQKNGDPPRETWYVTEHQTNTTVAPPNGMSGGVDPNEFPDYIGCLACRNEESQQTFFISLSRGTNAQPQQQITVHVPIEGDFEQLGIHVDSGGNRVNGYLHWPGVPFTPSWYEDGGLCRSK